MRAIGIVETRGLPGAIEAADAMVKSAQVRLIAQKKVGSGLIAVVVQGDVGAVTAAVEAGKAAASKVGVVIATNVLPNPHQEVEKMLPMLKLNWQEQIGGES